MVLNSKFKKLWHGFGTMPIVERQEQKRGCLERSYLTDIKNYGTDVGLCELFIIILNYLLIRFLKY